MTPGLQDFALSISLDSGLLRQSIVAGEQIPPAEIQSLAAAVEAIFIAASLESRRLGKITACHELWNQTSQLLEELCNAWTNIESDDSSVAWLRRRLSHHRELCRDRVELFSISESARREHAKCRESELRDPEPHPAVLKDFTEREVAHIDAALSRRLHSH